MREFRAGKSLVPLIFWAILATGAALLLRDRAKADPVFLLLVVALILLGPMAALAHAIRSWSRTVRLLPAVGLRFRSGRTIPWSALRGVWSRPALFDRDSAPGAGTAGRFFEEAPGVFWEGGLIFLVLEAVWIACYYLLLPAFVVLSPWQAQVKLRLSTGEIVVLRDLEDDREFVRLVKTGISGHRNAVARLEEACGLPRE